MRAWRDDALVAWVTARARGEEREVGGVMEWRGESEEESPADLGEVLDAAFEELLPLGA
jgi:hypothetical protein